MNAFLLPALRQIRKDLADVLEPLSLAPLCRSLSIRWRQRSLDPINTIHVFLIQILPGNTAWAHLPRLTGLSFTASAYCPARARLPLAALQALPRRITETLQPLTDTSQTWYCHRTWFIDGTGVSLPDTPPLQNAFGQPTNQAPGCVFPVARVLALFHAGTGLLQSFLTAPLRSHEMTHAAALHPELRAGDVLIGDRAFGTFAQLYLLIHRGLHGVFRMSQRRVVDLTPNREPPRWNTRKLTGEARSRWVRAPGPEDQVVEWYKPYRRPTGMSTGEYAQPPITRAVRERRYTVSRPGFRVRAITPVSTLLDADAYPAPALADLDRQRVRGDRSGHLKTTLGMDALLCETEAGVAKELTAFAVAYNLVRVVMLEASRRQQVRVSRLSFVDALRWLWSSRPGSPLPRLIVNPDRQGRVEPQCKKRRATKHPYMIHPRHVLRQRLLQQKVPA
jgi:hypothetical protein